MHVVIAKYSKSKELFLDCHMQFGGEFLHRFFSLYWVLFHMFELTDFQFMASYTHAGIVDSLHKQD